MTGQTDAANEPTGPRNETTATESDMSSSDTPDPTTEYRDPMADPTPFRVEPATPVPDDAVAEGARLPHLPPPPASTPDPSWPAPVVSQPARPWAGQPAPTPLVTVRKGPRPGSIMLGLLTLLVAAYILVANLTDADLSFRMVGPSMIGAFGGMLLLVGLAGVVAGRMRR